MNIGYIIGIISCLIAALYFGMSTVKDVQSQNNTDLAWSSSLLVVMLVGTIALAVTGARKKKR